MNLFISSLCEMFIPETNCDKRGRLADTHQFIYLGFELLACSRRSYWNGDNDVSRLLSFHCGDGRAHCSSGGHSIIDEYNRTIVNCTGRTLPPIQAFASLYLALFILCHL